MSRPLLQVFCHHPSRDLTSRQLRDWQKLASAALPACSEALKSQDAPLAGLEEIEVSLVSDEAIAQVHADFLNDPSATDVITFHHGEIVVSLDTAQRQAQAHEEPFEREVLRYMVHGLLHLAGWEDHEDSQRQEMLQLQERILADVWQNHAA